MDACCHNKSTDLEKMNKAQAKVLWIALFIIGLCITILFMRSGIMLLGQARAELEIEHKS